MSASEKNKMANNTMPMTGADVFIDVLKKNNVTHCFGYPGGSLLPIYDALFHSDITHYLTRHEQGAIHMAEGFAKASGKPGVVIATSGPGATNLTTGLMDAKLDSVPLVALTGQVPTSVIGTDAFQEADIYGISVSLTKYNALVKNADKLGMHLQEAFLLANSNRPGPCLVDIPKDVQTSLVHGYDFDSIEISIPERHWHSEEIIGDLEGLAQAINKSEKPLLYVGGGAIIAGAEQQIADLVRKASIPVVMTLNGLGAFPGTHELSLGMLGMHGTRYANNAVMETDLLISLGARFDDRVTGKVSDFASQAKKAHIDIDVAEIHKVLKMDFGIRGDIKQVLDVLLPMVKEKTRDGWTKQVKQFKIDYPLKFDNNTDAIKPQFIIRRLYEMTGGKAIVSSDVGQHQMWGAQYFLFDKPRSWLSSSGLGTMGFGFPAAIGAKVARPNELVVALTGDGSFQMNIQELATLMAYNIHVKILLLDNGFLGMVRQWQEMFYENRFSHTNLSFNPNFVKIAEAYGIPAKLISRKDEVDQGLQFLLKDDKSALLVVKVPEQEMVYPFIPAGGRYRDMMDFPG